MPRSPKSITNAAFLEAALEGLELQKARLEEQIAEVRRLLGRSNNGGTPGAETPAAKPVKEVKRHLSAAARKRIAAAQKRRWAAYRRSAEVQPA